MEIACFDFWVERSTTRVDICSTPAHSPISHSDSNYLPQLSRLSQVTWKVLRLTASQTSRQRNEVSEPKTIEQSYSILQQFVWCTVNNRRRFVSNRTLSYFSKQQLSFW